MTGHELLTHLFDMQRSCDAMLASTRKIKSCASLTTAIEDLTASVDAKINECLALSAKYWAVTPEHERYFR